MLNLVKEPEGAANLPRIRGAWYINEFSFDIYSHSLFFEYPFCINAETKKKPLN